MQVVWFTSNLMDMRHAAYNPDNPEEVLETLRVAGWASGLYLLHFQTSGGTFTRKLVVGR